MAAEKLSHTLRVATRTLHDQIELEPFFESLALGTVATADYRRFLVQALHLHQSLERRGCAHPTLGGLLSSLPSTADAACSDLAALRNVRESQTCDEIVIPETLALTQFVESSENAEFVGCAYVFEGAKNGGMILQKRLSQRPELRDAVTHLNSNGPLHAKTWRAFKEHLDQLPLDSTEVTAASAAARRVFQLYQEVGAGLARISTLATVQDGAAAPS